MKKTLFKLTRMVPKAGKALHGVCRYDLEKPFFAFEINGPFTIKKIEKVLSENGFSLRDNVALFIRGTGTGWDADRFYFVTVNNLGKIETKFEKFYDYRTPYKLREKGFADLDDFYAKYRFDETRKENTCCFVFAQKVSFMIPKTPGTAVDYFARFAPCTTGNYYGSWVTKFDEKDRDKSGYFPKAYRERLERRAEKLRAERAKASYIDTDNSIIIGVLSDRVKAIYDVFTSCVAFDEKSLEKCKLFFGYPSINRVLSDLNDLIREEKEKKFKTMETFNRAVHWLSCDIEKLEKLTNETTEGGC